MGTVTRAKLVANQISESDWGQSLGARGLGLGTVTKLTKL